MTTDVLANTGRTCRPSMLNLAQVAGCATTDQNPLPSTTMDCDLLKDVQA